MLRITQYLPDILHLQKILFDQFHQSLDQGNVLNMTIDDYIESLNNGICSLIVLRIYNLLYTRSPEASHTKVSKEIQQSMDDCQATFSK